MEINSSQERTLRQERCQIKSRMDVEPCQGWTLNQVKDIETCQEWMLKQDEDGLEPSQALMLNQVEH